MCISLFAYKTATVANAHGMALRKDLRKKYTFFIKLLKNDKGFKNNP